MKFKKGIRNAFKFRFQGKQRSEAITSVEHQSEKKVSDAANDERNVREENEAVSENNPAENATSECTPIRSQSDTPDADARETPQIKSSRSDISSRSLLSKKSKDKSVTDNKSVFDTAPIEPEAVPSVDQGHASASPAAEEASMSANPTLATEEAMKSPDDCNSVSTKGKTLCGLSLCLG
jgi:hypothetical protein